MARNAATSTVTWIKAGLSAEGMYRERVSEDSPPFRFTRRNSRREDDLCLGLGMQQGSPRPAYDVHTNDRRQHEELTGLKENASKHAHIHSTKYVTGAGESGVTPAGATATPCGVLIPFSLPDMSYRRAIMKRKAGEAGAEKHGRPSGRSK